ncbi:hypothetical protein CHS0354_014806 [Potamilus streckersoni]|uniref:Uncharacterized protein n=1 Tax=Potamilus streckersoni TaxID=2493646 RepID=A0AAE0VJ78_9BIVA|nr:hypothetical protein CHS0354_014806 [Potamilus streckersoni]
MAVLPSILGKKAFADVSLRNEPSVTRNYFETSHGKSVCDGLGATVKNACYRAVISNRKVIGCAEDVYHFCTEKLKMENTDNEAKTVSRREFILVKDVERNREETDVQTLQGTRKLHVVKSGSNDYELSIRNLSCYCEQCIKVDGRCNFSQNVNAWEMRKKENNLKDKNPSTIENNDKKRKQGSNQKDHNSATSEKPNKKQKSTERQNIVTKKIKVDKKAPTNTEKAILKYHPGEFVAVGLKPKKGPLDVYLAEVIDILHNEVRLKYRRKSGNMYVWPEKDDYSQEALYAILYRAKAPQIVNDRVMSSLKDLVALGKEFGYEGRAYGNLFRMNKPGRGMKGQKLAQSIKKLTRQAYPGASTAVISTLARDHFIDALPESDMHLRIRESRARDISEAEI